MTEVEPSVPQRTQRQSHLIEISWATIEGVLVRSVTTHKGPQRPTLNGPCAYGRAQAYGNRSLRVTSGPATRPCDQRLPRRARCAIKQAPAFVVSATSTVTAAARVMT